jgi:hypothetical protein
MDVRDHELGLKTFDRLIEVGHYAGFKFLGLSDIYHPTILVLHQVTAWCLRERIGLVEEFFGLLHREFFD